MMPLSYIKVALMTTVFPQRLISGPWASSCIHFLPARFLLTMMTRVSCGRRSSVAYSTILNGFQMVSTECLMLGLYWKLAMSQAAVIIHL